MKYRKKPVVIEAVQFQVDNHQQIKDFCGSKMSPIRCDGYTGGVPEFEIVTLEDGYSSQVKHVATLHDYIIKGIQGEFYPCKPDIFAATYERVED